jgi:hypothetical protein
VRKQGGAASLVGHRVRVFTSESDVRGRVGTVITVKASRFRPTENAIAFEDADGKLENVLLRKQGDSGSKGCRFKVLEGEVKALVQQGFRGVQGQLGEGFRGVQGRLGDVQGDVRDVKAGVQQVHSSVARVELAVAALAETALVTNRLVTALALGEIDCPRYAWLVPEEQPEGDWKETASKAKYWFHDLHSRQLRLVLVCAHDFQAVPCGPDGKGYPIKMEKDWVKKFFHTFGPVIKVGLFAAKVAVLASGVGAVALPFLPHRHPEPGHVDGEELEAALKASREHGHQHHLIEHMLETFGELMEEGEEAAEAHHELDQVLGSTGRGGMLPASKALQAQTAASYRSLRAMLQEQDAHLERVGLVRAVSGGAVDWVAPGNVAAWTKQRKEAAAAGAAQRGQGRGCGGGGGGGGGGSGSGGGWV